MLKAFQQPFKCILKDMEKQTPEERQTRLKKADSIRRMLADTTASNAPVAAASKA